MRDPIQTLICQPVVDRLGIEPRGVARTTADVFVLAAITLSALRVATLDAITNPGLHVNQTMHVVGAAIVHAWMRFVIANGAAGRAGPLGTLHAGMRIMFLSLVAMDMVDLCLLPSWDAPVTPMGLTRSSLQLVEDLSAGITLYLSIADEPPPPRRHGMPFGMTA